MRKSQIFGATLIALFALGALAAASASAVTFLLAEWLLDGIARTTERGARYEAELELKDIKTTVGEVSILCSELWAGWIGQNSLDYVTELLTLGEVGSPLGLNGGKGLACTSQRGCATTPAPEVYLLDLPWESELELMEDSGSWFADLFFGTNGTPGFEVVCMLSLLTVTDECKYENAGEAVGELTLEGATLLGQFSEAFLELAGSKLANCTQGGKETGTLAGSGAIIPAGGTELTGSSETSES